DVRDESAGTKNLFALGGIIIEALEEGHVLVVDELEKNLHPDITTFLIRLFHRPDINRNHAQLIFATHDVSQLSHDTFRRDQVWFRSEERRVGKECRARRSRDPLKTRSLVKYRQYRHAKQR